MGIRAEELRIGNLVYELENREREDGLTKITLGTFAYLDMGNENRINELYKPIPLTEEWLEKFGFVFNSFSLIYILERFALDEDFVLMDIDILVKVKYVHQLQNLYYSLVGKELAIKL